MKIVRIDLGEGDIRLFIVQSIKQEGLIRKAVKEFFRFQDIYENRYSAKKRHPQHCKAIQITRAGLNAYLKNQGIQFPKITTICP